MREQVPLPKRGQSITAEYMARVVKSVNLFNAFSVSGSAKYDSGTASLHVGGGSGSGAAIVAKTPVGGIPARAGDVLGSAACTRCQLGSDGSDVVVGELESEVTVLNLASGVVGAAGGVLIIAVKIDGHWVAVWEDCA